MIKNKKFDLYIWFNTIWLGINYILSLIALIYNICIIKNIFLGFIFGLLNGSLIILFIYDILNSYREQKKYNNIKEKTNEILKWQILHPNLDIDNYKDRFIK